MLNAAMYRDPIYQRAVQKIERLTPEEKAVLDITAADQMIAGMTMQNFLRSKGEAMTETALEEGKRQFGERMGFAREKAERGFGLDERRHALNVRAQDLETAKWKFDVGQKEDRLDLARKKLGFQRKQERIGRGIAIGNLVLSGASALAKNIKAQKRAEALENILSKNQVSDDVAALLTAYGGSY